MPGEDFIIAIFIRIDNQMADVKRHSQANLYPGEIVTLAILFAIKAVDNRVYYRWIERDWRHLFPNLPVPIRRMRVYLTDFACKIRRIPLPN